MTFFSFKTVDCALWWPREVSWLGVGWERGEMEAPKGEDKCTPTADSHSVQKKLMQLGKAIMLQLKKI